MKKLLSSTRRLCDGMKGQNYWFNGCMEYLMECLGENIKDYDYWFFSNITGDSLLQLYRKDITKNTLCPSFNIFDYQLAKRAFDACGYDFEYINGINDANRNDYLPKIKAYLDKDLPVLCRDGNKIHEFGCIYGYDGDDLYYLVCDSNTAKIYPNKFYELIFVGNKKEKPALSEIFRKTVLDIPSYILKPSTDEYSFGKQAFLDWADSFQNGTFDNIPAEQINTWHVHGTYLCMMGTNGCVDSLLKHTLELNPEMTFIMDIIPLYERLQMVFHDLAYTNGGMQGGFEIKDEVIKNKELMISISEKIREAVKICDEILEVFSKL